MYVLDNSLNNCEPWVVGEIFIGGIGVANGYNGDTERTNTQFVIHPRTKERLFRTFDLGRLRITDGNALIEILGRKDSQVKVNGFRIELGEIEQTIQKHQKVQSVAVAVHSNAIYAYFVPVSFLEQSTESLLAELSTWCRETLTDYMVPRRFIVLEKLPLSPNGKLLREGLLPPKGDVAIEASDDFDRIENSIRILFSSVLCVDEKSFSSKSSNFFSFGGTSVSAIQLMFHVKKVFDVRLHVGELFANPTIESISSLVRNFKREYTTDSETLLKSYRLSTGDPNNRIVLVLMARIIIDYNIFLHLNLKLSECFNL